MFSDLKNRAKKANQTPGTAVYLGDNPLLKTEITVIHYNTENCAVKENATLDDCIAVENTITWIHIEGLHDVAMIKAVAEKFQIHPLTVEDILNVGQRPKVDDYENYSFITLKSLEWTEENTSLLVSQLAIIFNKTCVITFQDDHSKSIDLIRERFKNGATQQARKNGPDYLVYRLIDSVIDNYFVALESIGEKIESVEDQIMDAPTPKNSRIIYRLKRQMLLLRKVIWPLREVLSHLLYGENAMVSKSTRVYIRDAYDHISQAIDTVETFRDILASLLDMYLSGLTMKTNDIIKTLTIITTIFIPIMAIASIYGMNVSGVPLMKSTWGFDEVALLMILSVIVMVIFFRRKKWL
ncbi:MAG: magnesium/cobalt transporter CorA [Coxiellaceae bacterium]|nr:magnesium/cobalt transporter CorA [Coxiellaceae bacterium]